MSDSDAFAILFGLAIFGILVLIWLISIISACGCVLYEAYLAPKLEQWAREYLTHRCAGRAQQADYIHAPTPVPVPVHSTPQVPPGSRNERPHASGVSERRNEIERKRTLSTLRRRTSIDARPVNRLTNVNPEFLPPLTPISFGSLATGITIPSRPAPPTPRVSPIQPFPPSSPSQVNMVLVASTISRPEGNNAGPGHSPVVPHYVDHYIPVAPPISGDLIPVTSSPAQQTVTDTLNSESRLLPAASEPGFTSPILFSPADGTYERVGSSPPGGNLTGFSLPSEIDSAWSSALSPSFPHFELPSVKLSSDADLPGDQGGEGNDRSLRNF